MTNYELMFIIDPVLDEEAKKETIETVKGIIAAEGAIKERYRRRRKVKDVDISNVLGLRGAAQSDKAAPHSHDKQIGRAHV